MDLWDSLVSQSISSYANSSPRPMGDPVSKQAKMNIPMHKHTHMKTIFLKYLICPYYPISIFYFVPDMAFATVYAKTDWKKLKQSPSSVAFSLVVRCAHHHEQETIPSTVLWTVWDQ